VLRLNSKSFWLAARLLPPGVADDAAVVYAFCRRADDAIDARPAARDSLEALRREVDSIWSGDSQPDALLSAFQEVALRRGIPRAYVGELLDGMEMDVRCAAYSSLHDLLLYCHRVAGTVGLMMCHLMGVHDPRALRSAAHLGIAMQLTNICRDVAEDWEMGRLYLPRALLGRSPPPLAAGPFGGLIVERARFAIRILLEDAERFYASADAGIPLLGFRCALAVRTARFVYAAIGRRIEARGCDPLAGRAVVPLATKLLLVAKAFLFACGRRLVVRPQRAVVALLRFPDDVLPL
jgi:phytoene synthase